MPQRSSFRRQFVLAAFVAATAATAAVRAQAAPFALNYLGQQVVATGTVFGGTTVGGLSGIDYDAATQQFWAISDDRSQVNDARFYTATLDFSKFNTQANPGSAGVVFTGVTTLRDVGGAAFGNGRVDPESIRKVGDRLIWSSEGERIGTAGSAGANLQNPFLREARLDGTYSSSYAVPTYYGTGTDSVGIRQNLAFESIAVSNDGKTVYTATENALLQDGPRAEVGVASPNRVLAFDRASGNPVGEYLYRTEPTAAVPVPAGSFSTNGLVELLNIPGLDGQFIAMERSFSTGVGYSVKLFITGLAGATNFAGQSTLPGTAQAMSKELLLDLGTLGVTLDNLEGISWGPLVNGKQTLVIVSDNNFSSAQVTQLLAFEVATPVPEPQSWAMLFAGLGVVAVVVRRRSR